MLPVLVLTLCVLVVVSLPFWLPKGVVALRMRVFAHLNGHEGIPVPGDLVGAAQFKEVYSHPAANGRSRGAGLSRARFLCAGRPQLVLRARQPRHC